MQHLAIYRNCLACFLAIVLSVASVCSVFAETLPTAPDDLPDATSSEETTDESESSSIATDLPIESEPEISSSDLNPESSDLTSDTENSSELTQSETESVVSDGSSVSDNPTTSMSGQTVATSSKKPIANGGATPAPTVSPEWTDQLNAIYNNACDNLKQQPQSNLFFVAMGCAGKSIDSKQYGAFLGTVSESTYVDLLTLVLTAINATFCGVRATNANGIDLIAQIADFPAIEKQSVEALAYALLALDSNPYTLPNDAKNTRQDFIDVLISNQASDGSFSHPGTENKLGITAVALAALAPYSNDNTVRNAINSGVSYLQQQYQATRTRDQDCITICRMMAALTCVGINVNDSRFVRYGNNLCDLLLDYLASDGGFKAKTTDASSDPLATESAIIALTAIKYFTSPYVTRQTLADSVSSADSASGDLPFNKKWLLLIPALLILVGGAMFGSVLYRRRLDSDEPTGSEKDVM